MQERQETRFPSLGWEDPLQEEMATHSSTLGWEVPWTEELGGTTVYTVVKSQTPLSTYALLSST